MRASEMAKELASLAEDHGDPEVYISEDEEGNRIVCAASPSLEWTEDSEGAYEICVNDEDYVTPETRPVVVLW